MALASIRLARISGCVALGRAEFIYGHGSFRVLPIEGANVISVILSAKLRLVSGRVEVKAEEALP